MALYIKDPHAEQLAGMLAAQLHSNKTRVVIAALEEYASHHTPCGAERSPAEIEAEVKYMGELARKLFGGSDIDTRSADEILGYDENGLPS